MGEFTFVPVWVAQDVLVLVAAVFTVVYILKKEERPTQILLEMVCFCLLDAAVYENFATLMKWYGYGRSLIMIFNVPLTVPVVEFLVIYTTLRVLSTMKIPTWCKPLIVGVSGMIFDFSMDPVATMQVFTTREATIGRWSWFVGPHDVHIFTDPVYNYTGDPLCGYAAAFLLLGRYWHRRSGYNRTVGYVYPIVTMLGALAILVSRSPASFSGWGPSSRRVAKCRMGDDGRLSPAVAIVLLATLSAGQDERGALLQGRSPGLPRSCRAAGERSPLHRRRPLLERAPIGGRGGCRRCGAPLRRVRVVATESYCFMKWRISRGLLPMAGPTIPASPSPPPDGPRGCSRPSGGAGGRRLTPCPGP